MKLLTFDTCGLPPIHDEQGDNYHQGGVLVIGEAGGYNEGRLGRPFVGDSGRVLDALLELAGLSRADVYLTNVYQHHPPGNKTPRKPEIDSHRGCVEAALEYAQPLVIVAVGGTALSYFRDKPKLTSCHGKAFRWRNTIVYPVFHPAYAMRNPSIWPLLHDDFSRLADLPEPPPTAIYRQGSEWEAVEQAQKHKRIGFDLETTDWKYEGVFYPQRQEIVGYSVAWADGQAVYVHGQPGPWMQGVLEDESIVKVCHNAKFEYQVLKKYGITLRNFEDTKLKAYLLQLPSSRLKDLSWQVLDVRQLELEDVTKGRPTAEVTAEEWVPYAAADADLTLRLDGNLTERLKREGLLELYYRFELPLVPILAEAEARGAVVDKGLFDKLVEQLEARRQELAGQLEQWFMGVNLNSNEQLAEVIFSKQDRHAVEAQKLKTRSHIRWVNKGLGLRPVKKTPTGQPALDKEVYAALEGKHPALALLAEYRRIGDYLSDFVGKIPRLLFEDGTLHTSINQAGSWEEAGGSTRESPATGRLSSSGPNLMQIPKRDAVLAKAIRRGFVARPGYVWVSVDMKQQEPRLMALVSKDKRLQSDFEAGVDVYMEIAHLVKKAVTGKDEQVVDQHERDRWGLEYRDTAKNKVFLPVQYGAGAAKLASIHPGLTIGAASGILKGLHARYPRVVEYAEEQKKRLMETGYAVTLFGRKRWLPGIWVRQTMAEAARQGANHPIQGSGADILKGCLIWLFGGEGRLVNYDAHLLWPIHDSIDIEVRESQLHQVLPILFKMTSWFSDIHLPVEVSWGYNWGELQEVHD